MRLEIRFDQILLENITSIERQFIDIIWTVLLKVT